MKKINKYVKMIAYLGVKISMSTLAVWTPTCSLTDMWSILGVDTKPMLHVDHNNV